ncbi:DUF4129 domain-containing transglutaminase family protein [Lapidilactobacillus mulanensis]|uniref:DUF4129 domain-containing transglutaminase family protein n=1 Tax=Lapidilactobacillus mulanensis TaxID=2485999 RepID=A0ABW4DNJ5_9LACO|nr:transglutaminase domain-containing protein [Lapidilactobacillus mulanensis]
MPKWLRNLIPLGLSLWLVAVVMRVFVSINPIDNTSLLIGAIIFSGLLVWGLSLTRLNQLLKLLIIVFDLLFWLSRLLATNRLDFVSWLSRYFPQIYKTILQLGNTGGVDMPQTLAVTLGLILVMGLFMLIIDYQQPLIAVLIALAYLMAVHIFNGNDLLGAYFQVSLILCLLLIWRNFSTDHSWKIMTIGLLPILIVSGIFYLVNTQTTFNGNLVVNTVALRNRLNAAGFYDAIDAYADRSRQTGFTENNQKLGGPIHDDNTVIMTVIQRTPHYLRVGAKDTYDGKGWERMGRILTSDDPRPYSQTTQEWPLVLKDEETADSIYDSTPEQVEIINPQEQSFIALPYGKLTLTNVGPGPELSYYDQTSNRLYPSTNIAYQTIDMTIADKNVTDAQLENVGAVDLTSMSYYLQLPAKLPARIKTLAEKVTKNAPTYYDKVTAITDFLSTDDQFTYSKVDTPTTPKNRDYVDYFLFDSKIGYCDNFSSAMVIMLRTLNIPARWTKGFNDGAAVKQLANGRKRYAITNSDAHSWPEVYFPAYGWLPFEPTPGFYNEDQPQATTERSETTSISSQSESSSSSSSSASSKATSTRSSSQTAADTQTDDSTSIPEWLRLVLLIIILLLIILTAPRILLIVFHQRSRRITAAKFPHFYRQLLWLLRIVAKRAPSQSLTSYAHQIDHQLELPAAFTQITASYEAQVFGAQLAKPQVAEFDLLFAVLTKNHYGNWYYLLKRLKSTT